MTPEELRIWDAAMDDAYGQQRVVRYNTEVKKEPALSRVPRGCWRNLWLSPVGREPEREAFLLLAGCTMIDARRHWGARRWPCKDSAETAARRQTDAGEIPEYYLGAEFFPEK